MLSRWIYSGSVSIQRAIRIRNRASRRTRMPRRCRAPQFPNFGGRTDLVRGLRGHDLRSRGVGAIARDRAHWSGCREAAGFLLTVRFANPGGASYGRCVAASLRSGRHGAGGAAALAHPAIERGRHGQRRERLLRHKARGGLSRPLAAHAGRLPRERGRARLPPLRQPGTLSHVGSG